MPVLEKFIVIFWEKEELWGKLRKKKKNLFFKIFFTKMS
jgi:hypothetical protein